MNYFKKIIDWVLTAYEPEFKPKRVYKYKGKTYYLRKRKKKRQSKKENKKKDKENAKKEEKKTETKKEETDKPKEKEK